MTRRDSAGSRKWFKLVRRAGWGVGDQAFSSLTNFALGILMARTQGPKGFGAFSLAFATYVVILNVSRALSTEPLVVRYSTASLSEWQQGAGAATGTALAVGVVAGAACAFVGWHSGGAIGGAFLALGLTMPGLMLQDSWRYAFFARGRGAQAFLNDAMWAVVLFPALGLIVWIGHASVFWLTVAWGGAATVAGLVGILQARLVPRPFKASQWLRRQWDLVPRFLGEFMALIGTTQLSLYVIGGIAGLEAVGAIRAAQILLGPVYAFSIGVRLAATPEAVRLLKRSSTKRLRRMCALLSGGLATVTLVWGLVAQFVPSRAGVAILASSWLPAHRVLVPITIVMAAGGAIGGTTVGLRALAAARRSLRARVWSSGVRLGAAAVGAAVGGAVTASWALAAASFVSVVIYWKQFGTGLQEYQRVERRPSEVPVSS